MNHGQLNNGILCWKKHYRSLSPIVHLMKQNPMKSTLSSPFCKDVQQDFKWIEKPLLLEETFFSVIFFNLVLLLYRISSVLFSIFKVFENNYLVAPWVLCSSPSSGPSCLRTLETFLLWGFSNPRSISLSKIFRNQFELIKYCQNPLRQIFLMAYSVLGLSQCYKCLTFTNRRKHLFKVSFPLGMIFSTLLQDIISSVPFLLPSRKTVLHVQYLKVCKQFYHTSSFNQRRNCAQNTTMQTV